MSLRALVPAVRGTGGERRSAAWQQVLLPRRLVSCRASGRPPKRVQSPSFLQWDRAELDEDGGSRLTTDEEAARDTGGDTDADWEVSTPRDSADFSRPWGDWGASYFDSAELAGADRVRGGAEPPFGDNDDDSAAFRGAPDGPDVTPLDRQELEDILSVSATGSQYAYYWGSFDTALQRVFASLFCGLVTANVAPIVAVPTGLYFLWAPVALAARRNAPLRRYAHAGIWHARVLRAEARKSGAPGGMVFDAMGDAFLPRKRATAVMRVLLGDDSGARVLLEVPMAPELGDIQAGDEAEVLVVSDDPDLRGFRAVREAYLPELGLWLSEYPFVERSTYRRISDAVAAERSEGGRA